MNPIVINTPFGSVSPISLKEFIKLIPTRENKWDTHHLQYYKRIGRSSFYESPLRRCTAVLLNYSLPLTPYDFLQHIPTVEVFKESLLELVSDIVVECAKNMGSPTHLVRLEPRLWMACEPKNFEIHLTPKGYFFACYTPNKAQIWKVKREVYLFQGKPYGE